MPAESQFSPIKYNCYNITRLLVVLVLTVMSHLVFQISGIFYYANHADWIVYEGIVMFCHNAQCSSIAENKERISVTYLERNERKLWV